MNLIFYIIYHILVAVCLLKREKIGTNESGRRLTINWLLRHVLLSLENQSIQNFNLVACWQSVVTIVKIQIVRLMRWKQKLRTVKTMSLQMYKFVVLIQTISCVVQNVSRLLWILKMMTSLTYASERLILLALVTMHLVILKKSLSINMAIIIPIRIQLILQVFAQL